MIKAKKKFGSEDFSFSLEDVKPLLKIMRYEEHELIVSIANFKNDMKKIIRKKLKKYYYVSEIEISQICEKQYDSLLKENYIREKSSQVKIGNMSVYL